MKRRIVISVGLLFIALTIAGIAADGETTPAGPEAAPAAASNPAIPSNRDLKRLFKMEQDEKPGGSGGIKCYKYECGERTLQGTKVECKDPPEETVLCDKMCGRGELNGNVVKLGQVDYVLGTCGDPGSEVGCEDVKVPYFTGKSKGCHCNTEFCNRPFVSLEVSSSGNSSGGSSGNSGEGSGNSAKDSSSSVSSPIVFVTIAALVIAVKVNIF